MSSSQGDVPMTSVLQMPPATGPMSDEDRRELADANLRAKKIKQAGKVAAFNGWSLGIFAFLSSPFALFDMTSLVMCVALSILSYNEFRGRKLLRHFDLRGPSFLGWNQVALLMLIVGYSIWSLYVAETGGGAYAKEIKAMPELASALGSIDELYIKIIRIVYYSLIAATLIFQGLNARYYFTRRQHLQRYLHETPAWVVDLQRAL